MNKISYFVFPWKSVKDEVKIKPGAELQSWAERETTASPAGHTSPWTSWRPKR